MLKCPGIKLTNLYAKMQKSLEVSGIGNHIYLYEMEIYISINNIFIEKMYGIIKVRLDIFLDCPLRNLSKKRDF